MITAHALPAPTLPKACPPQPHTTNQTAPTHRSIARDRTSGPRPFAIHPNFPPACAPRLPYRPKPTSPPIPHAKPHRETSRPLHTVRRQPSAVATPRPPPPPTARGGLRNKALHHAPVITGAPLRSVSARAPALFCAPPARAWRGSLLGEAMEVRSHTPARHACAPPPPPPPARRMARCSARPWE